MRLLESLASTFFRVFGITQPTEKTRGKAARFLFTVLCLVAAGLTAAGLFLYHVMKK